MNKDEAGEKADTEMRGLAGPVQFSLATNSKSPLQFPGGWRFPYDILLDDGIRVGERRVILFVHDDPSAPIEVESSDIDDVKISTDREYHLPELNDALNKLQTEYQNIHIETVERIWSVAEGKIQPAWRILFYKMEEGRYSAWIGFDAKGNTKLLREKKKFRNVVTWDIGRSRCRRQSVTIKLEGLSDKQKSFFRSQWLIWSCMAHAFEHLTQLGYGEIRYHEIPIKLNDTGCSTRCAQILSGDPLPIMEFRGIDEGWADDPTIVCHELGHAVWYLFFAPRDVSPDIKEGFADYFAATLVAAGKTLDHIEIGGGLPKHTKKNFKRYDPKNCSLPRLINGQPDGKPYDFPLNPTTEDPYRFGRKWANLLWDLRQQIGPEKADAIIFLAHFKPDTEGGWPKEPIPMATYFQSLIKTANDLKIEFKGWNRLEKDHL